jgi:hypothetical protein
MAANPPVQQEKQIVLDPQAVEIGFGDASLQTAVLSPPVTRLKELRGTLRCHWQTTFRQEHFSAPDASIAKNEFQRLIVHYEIYRNSASYLVRLASLARIIGDADNARRFALEAESISPTDEVRFQRAELELEPISKLSL